MERDDDSYQWNAIDQSSRVSRFSFLTTRCIRIACSVALITHIRLTARGPLSPIWDTSDTFVAAPQQGLSSHSSRWYWDTKNSDFEEYPGIWDILELFMYHLGHGGLPGRSYGLRSYESNPNSFLGQYGPSETCQRWYI